MKVYKKTIKSHSFNEDRFVATKNLFAVIDGATDLSATPTKYKRSQASILAGRIKSELEHFSGKDAVSFLSDLSATLYKEKPPVEASCGIAFMLVDDFFVHFASIGDCEILFKFKDGTMERFMQKELTRLDNKALSLLIDIAKEKNISIKAARPYINETLIKHRNLMNTPEGYHVFQPMEKPTFEFMRVSIPKTELDSVVLCTDGFAEAYTTLHILSSYRDLFKPETSIDGVLEQIKEVSYQDSEYNRYPRFKLIDDITVIKVDF